MQPIIDTAETGFASTTGFTIGNAVTWTGTNLLDIWIGSGLALLYELRFWIVALIIIGGVVYFAFRAFGFFRH